MHRFKDGERVKCRVLHPLPVRPGRRPKPPFQKTPSSGGAKNSSKGKKEGTGDDTKAKKEGERDEDDGADEPGAVGPVELSLRKSRLSEEQGVEEALKREAAPEVGSMAKVC